MELERKIYFITKRPVEEFQRYVEANKWYFFLEKDEEYKLIHIKSPNDLKDKQDLYIYLFEVKEEDYTDQEVEEFKKIGEAKWIEYLAVNL